MFTSVKNANGPFVPNRLRGLTVDQVCDLGIFLGVEWADNLTDYAINVFDTLDAYILGGCHVNN